MINGDRVRQAREIRGLTQARLGALAGVSQSNIARLEQQACLPSDCALAAIALHTDFPVSFFGQPSGPDFPIGSLLFRKRASLKSSERAQVRQLARLVFELFECVSGRFTVYDVHIPRLFETPAIAAKITRSALGYSPDVPITDFVRRLERNGIVVIALPFAIKEHDAFSLWADTDPRRPTLVMTAGKPGDRMRFNLAHELGHLVLHQAFQGTRADAEAEANSFAAEFLLPREVLRPEMLSAYVTLTRLAELKARWGVSIQALLVRAKDVQVISERQYKYLYQQLNARGWRITEPVPMPPERPRLLRKMIELAYGVQFDAKRVAELVSAPGRLVEQILDCYAGLPTSASSDARTPNVLAFPAPLARGT